MNAHTLLESKQGFELYKIDERNYMVKTPESFEKPIVSSSEKCIADFLSIVERGWVWVKVSYYIAYVERGKLKIDRREKDIRSNKYELFISTHYTTKEQAETAIRKVIPKAKEKFKKCNDALDKLMQEMDFERGFRYEGDTYGIHTEYDYINFVMDGFSFNFEIN